MSIYIEAIIVWILYSIGTKYILFRSLFWDNSIQSYIPTAIVSGFFGATFLFLFSHENFFKFAKLVEKREKKSEQKWLHVFIHSGKVLTAFLITTIGGPLIGALAVRFLLHKKSYRYLVIFVASIISAILWLAFYKGAISFPWLKYFNLNSGR